MIVIPGRIPIAIHPLFWLLAGLIGWTYSQTILGVLIWIGIIFFSVLIHELGHAVTAVLFKQNAKIQLMALGGLTSYEGPKLKFWQQFLITFNGPFFGFLLFLFASLLLQTSLANHFMVFAILKATQVANLFWTIVNLLPVLPLDGGQLLRIILEAIFGIRGFKAAIFIGAVIALLLSFWFFIEQSFFVGAIFFLFAFQGYESWKQSRSANVQDRDDALRKLLEQGEAAMKEGKKGEAKKCFEMVQETAKGGILSGVASQYLAFFYEEEGKHKEAFELLVPLKKELTGDGVCLLHKLAAFQKDFSLVAELSSDCYQVLPSVDVALRNARAFAFLKEPKPAGGWLQTAWQHGGFDLEAVLREEVFCNVLDDPQFASFIKKIVE